MHLLILNAIRAKPPNPPWRSPVLEGSRSTEGAQAGGLAGAAPADASFDFFGFLGKGTGAPAERLCPTACSKPGAFETQRLPPDKSPHGLG